MIPTEDILKTLEMVQIENLDVRAVTLGINLMGCADGDSDRMLHKIRQRIHSVAGHLVACCDEVSAKYGIDIVNKRLAVSKISSLLEAHDPSVCLPLAHTLDEAARGVAVDIIGGYTALVQKGFSDGDRRLIDSIPEVLSNTERVCASVNVAGTKAGINMDAVLLMGRQIKRVAELTADKDGFGAAKLCVFANIPEDNPFMAGAFLGPGEPGTVVKTDVATSDDGAAVVTPTATVTSTETITATAEITATVTPAETVYHTVMTGKNLKDAQVTFVDSSGLGAIVGAMKLLAPARALMSEVSAAAIVLAEGPAR